MEEGRTLYARVRWLHERLGSFYSALVDAGAGASRNTDSQRFVEDCCSIVVQLLRILLLQ